MSAMGYVVRPTRARAGLGFAELARTGINLGGVTADTRGFYLRLGYHGRGSRMRKGLGQSALRRKPDGWRRDLAELRVRRGPRLSSR